MANQPLNYGKNWNREELVLAFELYCRIPFNKTKANNPQVRKLARILGRSPAGVARKLGNFGSFDPQLRERGISGLGHASRLDREIWNEFQEDWNGLVLRADELRQSLDLQSPAIRSSPAGPSERSVVAKQRLHQTFFREAILSSYAGTCAVTGITVTQCLIASHIVPWAKDERFRTDPHNGICLSATFDRLFDSGLISITADLKVLMSKDLRQFRGGAVAEQLGVYHERPIIAPQRFLPDPRHLEWHREHVFQG